MFRLVSKKKYENLKTQLQSVRNDKSKETALKNYYLQKVLKEINSREEEKKIILENQKVKEK